MDWTWDPRKAEANRQKHGVRFELAVLALDDPLHVSRLDFHPFEERWQTVGRPLSDKPLLLFVVHTAQRMAMEGERPGRIISARKAEPHERRAYEAGEF